MTEEINDTQTNENNLQPIEVVAGELKEIRDKYAAGNATWWSLADEYGVTDVCIGQVVNRKTWKHIP